MLDTITEQGGRAINVGVSDKPLGRVTSPEPRRKRSNSLPLPKAEDATDKANEGQKYVVDDELERIAREAHHERTRSLQGKRKKSIIGTGIQATKLHFKSFVESKILSKSDRALDAEANDGVGGLGVGTDSKSGLSAKDKFKRRSSRTSIQDFEPPSLPVRNIQGFLVGINQICPSQVNGAARMGRDGRRPSSPLGLTGRKQLDVSNATTRIRSKTVVSATVEDPASDIPDNSRLVKGKSMPSLR